MIRLAARSGCGRKAAYGSSGGGHLRRNSRCHRRSASAVLCSPGTLFTLAKPSPGSSLLPRGAAPFSAVMIGQQAQQSAVKQLRWGAWDVRQAVERFREAMCKDRTPLEFLGLRSRTNISNLCGHASFVILALAYLETDVLALRGYAASGIGLSILFQFYRAQPLWIPISWNGVFLAINLSMIGLLLKERNDAEKLGEDPEQARMYRDLFEPVELTRVDFVRLMDLAERRVVPKGSYLSEEGKMQEEVFVIVEGNAEVESEGVAVCHLEPGQFVGSMCFTRFIQASRAHANPSRRFSQPLAVPAPPVSTAAGAVTSAASGENKKQLSSGQGSVVEPSAPAAAAAASDTVDEDSDELEYIDDSYIPGGAGVFEEARDAAIELLRKDSIVGGVAKALGTNQEAGAAKENAAGMERSLTTVVTTSEVVVYAWDMHLLRAFVKRRPLAGLSMHKAISADLNRKVDQSRGHDERYRLLLAEALDGGVITPIERKKLQRYRDLHGISSAEHEKLLEQHGWKEEEFEAGFQKGVAPRGCSKDFLKYEALVRRELAKGEVEEKGRQQLREFRAQAGIDAQEHLIAVEKQGWTADDYEMGGKGKAAELEGQAVLTADAQEEGQSQKSGALETLKERGISVNAARVPTRSTPIGTPVVPSLSS